MVINRDFDGVSAAAPVDGSRTVAGLGDGADIYDNNIVFVRLRFDRFHDIFCSGYIGLQGPLRIIVGSGRDHAADVEDIVRTGDASKNAVVVVEVAPDDGDARVAQAFGKHFTVLFAVAKENADIKIRTFVIDFVETGPAHMAGCTGHKYSFICHRFEIPPLDCEVIVYQVQYTGHLLKLQQKGETFVQITQQMCQLMPKKLSAGQDLRTLMLDDCLFLLRIFTLRKACSSFCSLIFFPNFLSTRNQCDQKDKQGENDKKN